MNRNYLPASPQGSAVPLDEAVCLAMFGEPSREASLCMGSDGKITIVAPWVGDDYDPACEARKSLIGREAIHGALLAGKLRAMVCRPEDGRFFHVPRGYWMRQNLEAGEVLNDETAPEGLRGQPLVVDEACIDDWRAVIGAENKAVVGASDSPAPRRGQYNNRRPTLEQQEAFRFLKSAKAYLPGGSHPTGKEHLWKIYKTQFTDKGTLKPKLQGKSLALTQFKLLRDRFVAGDRIDRGRWASRSADSATE